MAGASGSGKTTLGGRIAAATGIPHIEIDAVHWHAGWTANPRFSEEVRTFAETDASRVRAALAANPGLRVVRVRTARDADRLVGRLAAAQDRAADRG